MQIREKHSHRYEMTAQYTRDDDPAVALEGDPRNPEELLVAAHAACFATSLSSALQQLERPADALAIRTICELIREESDAEGEGWRVATLSVEVTASGDLDDEVLAEAMALAERVCPVSKALAAPVPIETTATVQAHEDPVPAGIP